MVNPWALLAGVAVLGFVGGGSYIRGRDDGANAVLARQKRDEVVRLETLQAAQEAAAEEIANITVVHTTIRQKAEATIREKVVYRDCVNDSAVVGLLDAARAGTSSATTDAAGGGQLPEPGAGSASNIR